MLKRGLAAFVLSVAFALCLAPGLALAADGSLSAGNITPEPTLTTQATAAFTHEGFKVTSPEKDATYEAGKAMDIKIETLKFIPVYVNGFLDSKYNYVFIDISKDGVLKKSIKEQYSTVSDLYAYAVGATITREFTPEKPGTYTVKVGFANTRTGGFDDSVTDENYVGSYDFKAVEKKDEPAAKKANPMTVKSKTVTVKASNAKKKAQSVKASKAFTVKKAKGAVTYKATKNVTKNAMKKVTVAKNGKVTVKKGTKAGTYKLKVKVTAAGDKTYKKGSKTVTLTVKVK